MLNVYPLCNRKVVKCEALKRKTNIPLLLKHLNIIATNKYSEYPIIPFSTNNNDANSNSTVGFWA